MGLLNDSGPWLNGMMQAAKANPAVTLIYARGAETVDLTGLAWVGRMNTVRQVGVAGAAIVYGDRDYIIPIETLVIGGQRVEPKRGDRIRETVAGVTRVFELVSQAGEPEWRWSDDERTAYRVHTKEQ